MKGRPLTLVLPYYRNQGMLREQQRMWRSYPDDLKRLLHVIVVDDGSPKNHAIEVVESTGIASFRLYRIGVDVRWNWLACRNLGMAEATTEWVLLTDIDHVLPAATLRALARGVLEPDIVYRFSRVDAPHLKPKMKNGIPHPHPNTWLLTREMYDRIGGYDERFSGFYGTDADFRERVQKNARAITIRSEALIRYPREVISDASTTTYGRKETQDSINVNRIRNERAQIPDWKPLRLTFPWTHQITLLPEVACSA